MSLVFFAALALAQQVSQALTIAPGAIEEPCYPMQKTDRLEFSFSADQALDFNLHYHDDEGVSFPLNFKAVQHKEGVFIAPEPQTYCLMWTNKQAEPVKLEYQLRHYAAEG
ncbi:MAG: hypothetical protein ABJ308_18570 [Halieaceae bacterium]